MLGGYNHWMSDVDQPVIGRSRIVWEVKREAQFMGHTVRLTYTIGRRIKINFERYAHAR